MEISENKLPMKVMTIFGTRPEAVKMAPLVKEIENEPKMKNIVCVTAQHRQMLDQVLDIFHIKPDFDLDIMQQSQTLTTITTRTLIGLDAILKSQKPDIVLVHGDTSTTFASALAAFYNQITVGHIEAGLRTNDIYSPFPEEMNRKLTSAIAQLHFAPTMENKINLANENINKGVYITGNTVIDALKYTVQKNYIFKDGTLSKIDFTKGRIILVTAHRRENLGEPLKNICNAIKQLVQNFEDIHIIYPVHPNPAVKSTVYELLGNTPRISLIEPIDVQDMHNLMAKCYMVMTDSGGLQEEAPALGKPVLVLRTETERPEAVAAGTALIAGTEQSEIIKHATLLLSDNKAYKKMATANNPYGDGTASKKIVQAILHHKNLH